MKFTNKLLNFLIAATVIGAIAIFYLKNKTTNEPIKQTDSSSKDVDKVVNTYLKQTTEQIAKEQYERNLALKKATSENTFKVKPQIINNVPAANQIHKDNEPLVHSPDLNRKILQENQNKKMDEIDKQEYARQYIENARRGGYHIELNEDLEVKSVMPIRKPSQDIDTVEILPSN